MTTHLPCVAIIVAVCAFVLCVAVSLGFEDANP